MSGAERLEGLLAPFYLLLMAVGYAHFFLCMLPGLAAAGALGAFSAWIWSRAGARLRDRGLAEGGVCLALLLWELPVLAGAALLGRWNGWLITYAPKGRTLGGCLAALGYLLGRLLAARRNHHREG